MNDLDRIRMITVNFSTLQGLKMVPLGLLLTVVSLWGNFGTGTWRRAVIFPGTCVVVAFFLYLLASWYYARVYGTVRPTAAMRRSQVIRGLFGGMIGLAAFVADITFKIPVSFIGLVFGLASLGEALWISRQTGVKVEPMSIGVAALLAVLSLIPLAGANWWAPIGFRSLLFGVCVITGILFVTQGIWEHTRLVRLLPRPQEADHEQRI